MRIGRPEAFTLTDPDQAGTQAARTYGTRAWQVAGWDAYDQVPESHATTAFIAACLSRLRFKLAWTGDDDEPGPVWDEDGKVREDLGVSPAAAELGRSLVRTIRARRGGQTSLLAKIGANLAQVGDLSVVPRERYGRRYFDAYSIDELRPQANGTWIRYAGPGRQAEVLAKTEAGKRPLVIRIHREHPRYSEWADSSVRALLPTLEVMVLLTQELRSSTVSRIMGPGILWVSEEADLPPDPNDPKREGLTAQLATVGAAAVSDKTSAAALVPVIVRVPQEVVEKGIKETKFAQTDLNTIPKRDSAVNTFARGSELPVEQVVGMSNANHWGAWMIDETTAKIYIAPLMEIVCAILTEDYLIPSLANALKLGPDGQLPDDYAGLCVHYDDTALVVHPDRSEAAQDAHGTAVAPNFAISDQAYREARGFAESAAPDDEEVERRIAIAERLRKSAAPSGFGANQGNENGPGGVKPGPPAANNAAANGASVSPNEAVEAEMLTRISAAVEVAAERAVDRLGARLRSAANAKLSAADLAPLSGRPARDVPVLLGANLTASIIPPDQQFTGEFAALERTVTRWMNGSPVGPQVAARVTTAAEALARALSVTSEARIDPTSLAACVRGR